MLDLADYDLKLIHVPGSKLCTPDALSRWPDLIPKIDNDNEGVTLLPHSLFVNLINTDLNDKIVKSSEKTPWYLMPSKPLKGKSPPNSDPASWTGPMMRESSFTRAEYSYLTETISEGILSNYTMTTRPPDTPAI